MTSSLRGKIVDAQGGFMPGVTLKLVNTQTSAEREVVSDETGAYQFAQVPPGVYELSADLPGFAKATAQVTLQVNTPATVNLTMQLAGVAEAVTVESKVTPVNTVDATVGNAFREVQVRQLPLMTRNVVELLSLQPGVTPTGEVVGARRDQNNITLDGVDINDNQTSGMEKPGAASATQGGINTGATRESGFNAALPVPLDSVQEFRVTVSGQNANQGRSSGGQVTLITKSGTNQFHGSAYEYNRDTKFASNTFFNNRAGIAKEQLKRNQYGVSFGGPITRDRIFFFGNVERRTDDSAQTETRNVPSATLRAGTITVRATNGQTYALTPDILKSIDPLGLGPNPAMLNVFSQLPETNDPSLGRDLGLNFAGFRFNAPLTLDNRAYVGKVDVKLDAQSRHSLSVRATVADMAEDVALAQLPGQDAASVLQNTSYGVSASYTTVLSSNVVNVANFGLTNIRLKQTGVLGPSFSMDSLSAPTDFTRPFDRAAPTYNFVNDFTWLKGTHSVSMGGNLRLVRNRRTSYSNAFPSFSISRGNALGLGSDITTLVNNYLAATYGPTVRMADANSVQRAMLDLFGIITTGSMTYSYDRDGSPLPIGEPTIRNFQSNEWELYFGDSWSVTPNLTLTYGLRYVKLGVPYEASGLQVAPVFALQDFFQERLAGMKAGIPSNQLPHNLMEYDFIGPENGKASWFGNDNNNFAPRVAVAYTPDNWLSALTGPGGVIRAGFGVTYDRFGSDLVTKFDNNASFGLSEIARTPSVNVATGQRWNGTGIPLPSVGTHTFPFTPPAVDFIGGNYMGIDTTLHTPYSYNANVSVARELRGGLTVEAGYIGRWSKDLLMQTDAGGWAILFTDPSSGQTWKEMAQAIRAVRNAGITPAMVRANPSLVAPLPWIENMAPALANMFFPGSATANYYDLIWGQFGGSDADAVHAIDRVRSAAFPNCIIRTGCFTMYPTQSSGMSMWTNAGHSDFNGMTLSLRKMLSGGVAFDVNYTLARARDNGGAPESGGGSAGGIMLNPYDLDSFYGYSDFDVRHNINSNVLVELPFGRGKKFMNNAGAFTDALVSGWLVSGIFRYRSGLPTAVQYTGLWPTNFSFSTLAYATGTYDEQVQINENGLPALFANPQAAAANWQPMLPGEVGTRAAMRLDDFYNTDLSVTKNIGLPRQHRIQVRIEAFNLFNNVNFTRLNLDAASPANFGQFTATSPARVMQFALRYEF